MVVSDAPRIRAAVKQHLVKQFFGPAGAGVYSKYVFAPPPPPPPPRPPPPTKLLRVRDMWGDAAS